MYDNSDTIIIIRGGIMWNGNINDINEVVSYLNAELEKGRSQKDIEINDFKVNERVIAKRLNRLGYKKNNNQWLLNNDNGMTVLNAHIKPVEKKDNDDNIITMYDDKTRSKLLKLADNYDKIIDMINRYDEGYDKEYDGIIIELPLEDKSDFRTTIRVNNIIWEQFNEFAETYKEFTKKDLLSMALKEYMTKYKK